MKVLFLIGIIIGVFLLSVFLGPVKWWVRGSVTGEYVKGYSEGYGEFCGQYPFCYVVLKNVSCNGPMEGYGNKYYFGNQYDDVLGLEVGKVYTFVYHMETRMSDACAGSYVDYYVLESIWMN